MHESQSEITDLAAAVEQATTQLKLAELESSLASLEQQSQQADFWHDQTLAQQTMKRISDLKGRIDPWRTLQNELAELKELHELNDLSLANDLTAQLKKAKTIFAALKTELNFSGPYDERGVILSIHAGAGGTDAQDWAQMLERMYLRWAETHGASAQIDDRSAGETAGIKSVTIEITGPFAYGKLKGEHGVHRLVRLSPFNSDNLRQTSFAKVEVLPKVDQADEVGLDEKELKVDVYRAGGHGGQSVNTTDSAVRVTHVPTGITVSIQNERSQLQNKETALTILRSRLAQLQLEQHKEKLSELKGPNQSAEWGNQIRSYVLHPYKQVKDLRTKHESSDPDKVLSGDLDPFITAYLEANLSS